MWDAYNFWGLSGLFVIFAGLTPGTLCSGKTKRRMALWVEEGTIGGFDEMGSLHLRS